MNIIKRLSVIMAAGVISLASFIPAGAEEVLSDTDSSIEQNDVYNQEDETVFNDEVDYENDPSYLKFKCQGKTSAAIYGASNLVHNSKFANAKKVYGIDVSYFNSTIDWNKVKNAGVDFAIIRVGYRGYGNGALVIDSKFKENLKNAKAAGIGVGLYFFTQAINTTEAKEEANFVLNQIKGYTMEMPIYIDIEEISSTGRLERANISYNTKTNICSAFCSTIQSGGYRAGVYASYNWLVNKINGPSLAKSYDIWIAHYASKTPYTADYSMWQYTGQGYTSGVPTNVDMNVLYLTKAPARVTTLKGTKSGTKVNLSWSKSFGAYGYAIYAKDTITGKIAEVCKTTATSKTVTIPYSKTQFYVKSYYKINDNYSYSAYSNAVSAEFNKVTDLRQDLMTHHSPTTLEVVWSKVSNASGYEVQVYDEKQGKYVVAGYTTSGSYWAHGLEHCTAYKYRVRAYFNSDGTSGYNAEISEFGEFSNVAYAGTKTEQTKNVVVSNPTNTTIDVAWDKISEKCDGYQVSVYNYSTGKTTTAGWTGKNTNKYTVKNLKAGGKYQIRVRAYYLCNNAKIPGVYSEAVEAVTKCVAPGSFKASGISAKQCTLSWSKTTGAEGYKIYEYVNNKNVLVGTCTGTSYTIKNLTAYSTHKYRVWAYKTIGSKQYLGTASSMVTVNLAAKPTSFSVGDYNDTSVTLKWKATSGASKYVVYLYNSSTKKYTAYKTVKSARCTLTKLKKNTTYKVAVRAVYGSKYSDYSAVQTVSTSCATPTGVKFTKIGSTTQTISWKKVSGATNYWIYKYNPSTKKYYKFKEVGNVSSATLTGLKRNTSHRYMVYAVKKTVLKTYHSSRSSVVSAWTKK